MKLYSAYIIEMSLERKHAFLGFVVPNLDQVVVAATNKHRLRLMEMNASHRAYKGLEGHAYHCGLRIFRATLALGSRKGGCCHCGVRPGSMGGTCERTAL